MPEKRTLLSRVRNSIVAQILLVCIGSLFAVWLLFASLMAISFGGSPFDNNPFDDTVFNRSHWLNDQNCCDGSDRRGHMAQDIIRHHLKSGMPKQEIVSLLGVPQVYTASEFQADYGGGRFYVDALPASKDSQPQTVLRYPLGEELDMAWGIDHAALYVYLRNGKYQGSRIGWPG